jgi:hypothetical protein
LVEVSDDQLVAGLGDLVEHWIEGGAVVYVLPPSEWLAAVLLKLLRQSLPVYDRAPCPSKRRRPDDAGQRVLSVVATTTGSALPAATAPGSASREPSIP